MFPQGGWVRDAITTCINAGKTPLIIDAGANVGFSSVFFARTYPEARILAIEPDKANAMLCSANTEHCSNVQVFEGAIGAGAGYVSVERREGDAWGTRTFLAETGVPILMINTLLERNPDSELLIVKIDIEGFEKDLFSHNIEWLEKTKVVIVEIHDWLLPGLGTSQSLQNAMLGRGYEMLISGEHLVWIKKTESLLG